MYTIHYPYIMTIDADNFMDAAKRYVKMNRNYNVSQIVMSDRMNNYKRAMVEFYKEQEKNKAKIKLHKMKADEYGLGNVYERIDNSVDTVKPRNYTPAIYPQVLPGYQMNTIGMGGPLPAFYPTPDGYKFTLGPE